MEKTNETKIETSANVKALEDILQILVPPDTVKITDINGNTYEIKTAISARNQIKVFRLFKDVSNSGIIDTALDAMGGQDQFTGAGVIDMIIALAGNEQIAETLGSVFTAAFPNLIDTDPLDTFPIEEIVGGVAPLFLRFLQKTGGAMSKIAGMVSQAA